MSRAIVWGERASILSVIGVAALASAFGGTTVAIAASAKLVPAPEPTHERAGLKSATEPPQPKGHPAAAQSGRSETSPVGAGPSQLCTVMSIRFATGAPTPGAATSEELGRLASYLVEYPNAHVRIHGHADARGTDGGNLILSRQRAFAIAAPLQAAGVSSASMTVQAYGSFTPIEGVPAWSGDNRRVDIFLRGAPCPELKKVVGP